jgi:cell division control protein 45
VNQKQPGVDGGKIARDYKPGKGGIVVFDDGDIEEELDAERDAYLALVDMPEVDENEEDDEGDTESEGDDAPADSQSGKKRKSWSDRDEEDESSDDDDDRPRQRRRSNSVCCFTPIILDVFLLTITSVQSNPRFTNTPKTARTSIT